MRFRNSGILSLTVALIVGLQASSHADTVDLQAAAQANPNLIHQWTFDGADITARLRDSKGAADLFEVSAGIGTPDDLGYGVAGFDPSSEAASPFRLVPGNDSEGGASFLNNGDVTLGTKVSYEVLFKPSEANIEGGTFNLGYILSSRVGSTRGYFLIQGSSAPGGVGDPPWGIDGNDFSTVIGGSFNPSNEQTVAETMTADNWYYVAGSYDTDAVPGSTVVTNYIADLTAGETSLTTVGPLTVSGTYPIGATPFGIGGRWDAGETFPGMIDEVNLYSEALGGSAFQSNLDQLLVGGDPCDFNGDGMIGFDDLEELRAESAAGTNNLTYDVTGDGNVDFNDILEYVNNPAKLNSYIGDSNGDGEFNSTDFVAVFIAGEYEDAEVGNSTWAEGDWNGDGEFDSSDFVVAFIAGGYEIGPRAAAAVPEPSTGVLALFGLLVTGFARRKR